MSAVDCAALLLLLAKRADEETRLVAAAREELGGLLNKLAAAEQQRDQALAALRDVRRQLQTERGDALLTRIGLLEETVLAAATLLYPGDDWGPRPPGPRQSYDAYLSEGVYETAGEIRDVWKARGWRRG